MPKARRHQGVNVSFFAFQDIITSVTGILILIVIFMVLMLRAPGLVDVQAEMTEKRSLQELQELIDSAIEQFKELATIDIEIDISNESEPALNQEIEALTAEIEEKLDPLRLALLKDVNAAESELDAALASIEKLKVRNEVALAELDETKAFVDSKADFVKKTRASSQIWLKFDPSEKTPIVLELDSKGIVLRDLSDTKLQNRKPTSQAVDYVKQLAKSSDGGETYFVFFIRPSGIDLVEPLKNLLIAEGFGMGYRPLQEGDELVIYTEDATDFTR